MQAKGEEDELRPLLLQQDEEEKHEGVKKRGGDNAHEEEQRGEGAAGKPVGEGEGEEDEEELEEAEEEEWRLNVDRVFDILQVASEGTLLSSSACATSTPTLLAILLNGAGTGSPQAAVAAIIGSDAAAAMALILEWQLVREGGRVDGWVAVRVCVESTL